MLVFVFYKLKKNSFLILLRKIYKIFIFKLVGLGNDVMLLSFSFFLLNLFPKALKMPSILRYITRAHLVLWLVNTFVSKDSEDCTLVIHEIFFLINIENRTKKWKDFRSSIWEWRVSKLSSFFHVLKIS